MDKPVILIADFFGSTKARGIPAYVRDLVTVASDVASVRCLRAPAWVKPLPNPLQNLLMVLHEQLVVPAVALFTRADLIVFPYNSASFLCSLTRRSVCIIHDLVPYRRLFRKRGMVCAYLFATTQWHAWLGGRFAAVSPYTMRVMQHVSRFRGSSITYLPNSFASVGLVPAHAQAPVRGITLVSGIGSNKDFLGALALYAAWHALHFPPGADTDVETPVLEVVGFGEHAAAGRKMLETAAREHPEALARVTVHDMLPQATLNQLMQTSAVIWAHTRAEGFGRVVVEGRIAARPVVMSRLAVFRPFRDPCTFSYLNGDVASFSKAMQEALDADGACPPYGIVAHLRRDMKQGLHSLLHASP
jgi:hypothetical protein